MKNENSVNQEKKKKPTFVEMWEKNRKMGVLYYTIIYALYSFLVYLFIKVLYQLYIKDFSFKVDWWAIIICLALGPTFYYICEKIYKKKNK